MGGRGRTRTRLLLGVAVLAAVLGVAAELTGAFHQPELDSIDARFSIRGAEPAPADVVVVGVDDVTFDELGRRWPFPRGLHARIVDRLARDGALVIAYDVQFTEPTNPREDNALITAVRRAERTAEVVLATTEVGRDGQTNVFGGDAVVRRVGATAANGSLTLDPGGVVRRAPYAMQELKAFGVAAAEAPGDVVARPSEFGERAGWIDYAGPPGTIDSVSFSDVLQGDFAPGAFEDRFVVVGVTAPSLQDVHPTSVGGADLMSGPELQANTIATVRQGLPLEQSPRGFDLAVIVLLGLLTPLSALRLSPLRGLLLAAAAAAAYAIAVQLGFNGGVILPFVVPLATLTVGTVGTIAVHYVTAALERQRVRDLFARFVPEAVVDQVLAAANDDLRLGGVQIEGTVLFSDLRGFTTFSETRPAKQVIEILNRYLGRMTEVILDHGGTLTTYIGDGIMAVFGAPIEQPDHADRALAAAKEMLEEALPEFNSWVREQGIDDFEIGIGLNSGPVMAGNIGSEKRLEYTVIGDTVNTASRLEQMTKDLPHSLLVAGSTSERLAKPDELEYVDELAIRGRRSTVVAWTLASAPTEIEAPRSSSASAG